jgi:hypothetical protein
MEDELDDLNLEHDDVEYVEMEPISLEEADRVISALNLLMTETSNPSIQHILEDACCEIAELIPEADDESDGLAEAA